MEAGVSQAGYFGVAWKKSSVISFSPALLKEVDLQVQTLLIAVIYCVGHFSADALTGVCILNDNGTLGQNLSFPTFLPTARCYQS